MLQSFTLYMYGQFVPPWLTVLTGLSPDFTASEMIGITIHGSSPMAKVHRANSNIPYTPTNQLGSYCINDLAMSMKTLSPTLLLVVAQKKYANVDLKNVYIKTLCPTLSLIFAHKTIQNVDLGNASICIKIPSPTQALIVAQKTVQMWT